MNKLGIQWQEETDAVLEYNRSVRPRVLKSINCHGRKFWQQLKDDNPGSIRIYRHYPNFDCWQDDPGYCAYEAVMTIKSEIGHILDLVTHVEDNNEWIHSYMHDQVDNADMYMEAFIQAAWNALGLRTMFLNSACGHWGDDIAVFRRTLETAERFGAVLGQHEYDYPTMDRIYQESGDYWLCGKWKKSMAAIKVAGYQGIKCVMTECGIDGGVADKPMKGWRSVPNALENYAASLLWYNDLLNGDEDVLGAAIFGISMLGEWSDFDIEGSEVPARIAQFPTAPPPEPPEPPTNGGNTMRVFNLAGEELFGTEALDLIAFHGITVHKPVGLRQGEYYWAVTILREGEGPACTIVTGLLEDGSLAVGQEVAWAWTDNMGDADEILGKNYPTDWQDQADLGWLNDQANIGLAFGQHGWYHDPYKPGPGRLWVRDKLRWSVRLTGIGMLGMTNHRTMYPTFQIRQWAGDEEEPPNGKLDEILAVAKDNNALLVEIKGMLTTQPPPPPPPPPPPEPPEETFTVKYFNNTTLSGTPVWTTTQKPPFWNDWGSGSPHSSVNVDNFSGRWVGRFTFAARTYTFNVKADDGIRLWVAGKLVIDKWHDQAPTIYSVKVPMTAGMHEVKIEWYERTGGATLHANWQ